MPEKSALTVLDQLASARGRNDEQPNVELAEKLAASGDKPAIAELAGALSGKSAGANDAIKTLYEIGERKPALIASYAEVFFTALKSKNNRLVWGAMSALDTIATMTAPALTARLPEILDAAEKGSVIAKDKAVSILCKLIAAGQRTKALPPLFDMLQTAAINQLPSYAESAAAIIGADGPKLAEIITARLPDVPQPAKRARLEKVLRKLAKG